MAESNDQEKTEEATPQRRLDFRKRGQVAQTKELATVLSLLSMLAIIWLLGRFITERVIYMFSRSFSDLLLEMVKTASIWDVFEYFIIEGLALLAPLMLLFLVMSVSASLIQVGFLQNEEALKPKWERLNPVQGLKRIFSLKQFVEGMKSVAKLLIIGLVVFLIIYSDFLKVPYLVRYSVGQLFTYVGDVTLRILGGITFVMAALAGLDYLFQRWEMEKQMRMSKQELKEELKSREGDPLVKARIRRIQRDMARQRMMNEIPDADVVITNPTHISVVIKYEPEKFAAPRLVAAGKGFLALKIREKAKECGIPIIENKPLARTIFKTMKVGQVIPRELFKAVAQVLSYVFRLKGKVRV